MQDYFMGPTKVDPVHYHIFYGLCACAAVLLFRLKDVKLDPKIKEVMHLIFVVPLTPVPLFWAGKGTSPWYLEIVHSLWHVALLACVAFMCHRHKISLKKVVYIEPLVTFLSLDPTEDIMQKAFKMSPMFFVIWLTGYVMNEKQFWYRCSVVICVGISACQIAYDVHISK